MHASFNKAIEPNCLETNYSCDFARRESLAHSSWQRIWHFREKRELDSKIEGEVLDFFRSRYGFQADKSFKTVWKAIGARVWTPKTILTADILRALDTAFKEQLIYHGPGIRTPQIELEQIKATSQTVQQVIQALFHGSTFSHKALKPELFRAVLVNRNADLLNEFRQEMQLRLEAMAQKLPQTPGEEVVWRAFLGNIIALLPFSYPSANDTIKIPMLENGVCRLVDYAIQPIPLRSTTKMATPMTALGLTPREDIKAPFLLAFIGTTYPAGEGFADTILADFTPQLSVGESVYNKNRETIDTWLKDKQNVHICGVSLGGAMAFHTLRHHPEKLARIDVYNPPGLYTNCWEKELKGSCSVNIYCQAGDLVTNLGSFPEHKHVSLYRIIPHYPRVSKNILSAHARVYTGFDSLTVVKRNPVEENQSCFRRFLTKLHLHLGPFLVYYPFKALLYAYYYTHILCKKIKSIFSCILGC